MSLVTPTFFHHGRASALIYFLLVLFALFSTGLTAQSVLRNIHFDGLLPLSPHTRRIDLATPNGAPYLHTSDVLSRPLALPAPLQLINCNVTYFHATLADACTSKPLALYLPASNPGLLHVGPTLGELHARPGRSPWAVFGLKALKITVLDRGFPVFGRVNMRITGWAEDGSIVGKWETGFHGANIARWMEIPGAGWPRCVSFEIYVWIPGDMRREMGMIVDDLFIDEEVLDPGEVVRGLDPGVLDGVETFALAAGGVVFAGGAWATTPAGTQRAIVGGDAHEIRSSALFNPVSMVVKVEDSELQGANATDVVVLVQGLGMCGPSDGLAVAYSGLLNGAVSELPLDSRMLGTLRVRMWLGEREIGFEVGELKGRRWGGEVPGCERAKADPGLPALGEFREYPKVPR